MATPSPYRKNGSATNVRRSGGGTSYTDSSPQQRRMSFEPSASAGMTSPQNYSLPGSSGARSGDKHDLNTSINNNANRMYGHPSSYQRGGSAASCGGGGMVVGNRRSFERPQQQQQQHREPPSPSDSEGFFPMSSRLPSPAASPGRSNVVTGRWTSSSSSSSSSSSFKKNQKSSTNNIDNIPLTRQKEQWNVQRDIPTGTVRNNPFLPQPKPAPPQPVQLMHQKKQWDTSGIPRGSVAARAQTMEYSGAISSVGSSSSTSNSARSSSPGGGVAAVGKGRSVPTMNLDYTSTPSSSSTAAAAVPRVHLQPKTMSLPNPRRSFSQARGVGSGDGSVGNSNLVTSPKWEPSHEIPKGTVKGRMTSLFGDSGAVTSASSKKVPRASNNNISSNDNDAEEEEQEDDDDEDPWIIPDRQTTNSPVVLGNEWGEAVASAKSGESDDWDAPAKEWIRSSTSDEMQQQPQYEYPTQQRQSHHQPIVKKNSEGSNATPSSRHPQTWYDGPPAGPDEGLPMKRNSITTNDKIEMRQPSRLDDFPREASPAVVKKVDAVHSKRVELQNRKDSFSRDGDAEILKAAKDKSFLPVMDRGQQPHQQVNVSSPRRVKDLGPTSRKTRPSLAPPPKDASAYHQPSDTVTPTKSPSITPNQASSYGSSSRKESQDSFQVFETSFAHTAASDFASSFGGKVDDDGFGNFDGVQKAFLVSTSTSFKEHKATPQVKRASVADSFGFPPTAAPTSAYFKPTQTRAPAVGDDDDDDEFFDAIPPANFDVRNKNDNKADGFYVTSPSVGLGGGPPKKIDANSLSPRKSATAVRDSDLANTARKESEDCEERMEEEEQTDEPKKKRRGIFKFFGRGGKSKETAKAKDTGNKGKKSKSARKDRGRKSLEGAMQSASGTSAVQKSSPTPIGPGTLDDQQQPAANGLLTVDTQVEHSSTENHPEGQNVRTSHSRLKKGRSEDDTTVSDMTLPSVFKDISNPPLSNLKERMSPALSTIASREPATPTDIAEDAGTPKASSSSKLQMAEETSKREWASEKTGVHAETVENMAFVDPDLDHLDMEDEVNSDEDNHFMTSQKYHTSSPGAASRSPPPPPPHQPVTIQRLEGVATSRIQRRMKGLNVARVEPPRPSNNAEGPKKSVPVTSTRASTRATKVPQDDPEKSIGRRRLSDRSPGRKTKLTVSDLVQKQEGQPIAVAKKTTVAKRSSAFTYTPAVRNPPRGVNKVESKPVVAEHKYARGITKLEPKPAKTGGITKVESKPVRTEQKADVPVQSAFSRHLASRKNRVLDTKSGKTSNSKDAPRATAIKAISPPPPSPASTKRSNVKKKMSNDSDAKKNLSTAVGASGSGELSNHSSASYDVYQNLLAESLRKAKAPTLDTSKDDYSVRSARTFNSQVSMESDVRVLREILRRPRRDQNENIKLLSYSSQDFPTYDEDSVTDPMQRAGLRLLSAAIIPIQAEVRRFLAMRRALTRMWALIVIQTYTRRYVAQKRFKTSISAIKTIQAASRGHAARNDIIMKHICAIEIQRYIRGYLATMRVYEEIYRVTLIQSWVRMRIAMDDAAYRMALVIQVQAVARGFLVRKRIADQNRQATVIQTAWRCFYNRLTYQFDLLDIIIVQSLWRMKLGQQIAARKRDEKRHMAATLIQAEWRAYDCRMDYVCYLAARVIQTKWRSYALRTDYVQYTAARTIQSKWRSYECRTDYIQYTAARTIQSKWRSYECRTDYVQYTAARTIQSKWRSYECRNDYIQYTAARTIQSKWRSYDCRTDYVQYIAARTIQSKWRSHIYATNFVQYIAARTIQSKWRSSQCRGKYVWTIAARTIQSKWRSYDCRSVFVTYIAARKIQTKWRSYDCSMMYRRYCAARTIQKTWRSYDCKMNYLHFLADVLIVQSAFRRYITQKRVTKLKNDMATVIQTAVRAHLCARAYKRNKAATIIQSSWRAFVCYADYEEYKLARRIQTAWRRYFCYNSFKRQKSATAIQSAWRGYVCYTVFKLEISATAIQSAWRGYVCFNAFKREISATAIQSAWRGYVCCTVFKLEISATAIQSAWRGYVCFNAFKREISATAIQSAWRGYVCYTVFKLEISATAIQSAWRGYVCFNAFKREISATAIQSAWRGCVSFKAFTREKSATAIQSAWRGYVCFKAFKIKRSATVIQSAWRGFVCYADYMFTIADVVVAQKSARGWLSRRAANRKRKQIQENAAIIIQRNWRRFVDETEYVVMKYEYYATRKIQTAWRRFWCFSNFIIALDCSIQIQAHARRMLERKFFLAQKSAALLIQTSYRSMQAKKTASCLSMVNVVFSNSDGISDRELTSANTIQRVYRGHLSRVALTFHLAAIRIQKIVRGKQAHVAVRLYLNARRIQRIWRGFIPRRVYVTYTAARRIQNNWRCHKAQEEMLVRRGEFLAATLIQSAWRGFVCYTDYVFTLSDIVSAQRITRGFLARSKYSTTIRGNYLRKKNEENAAVAIQRYLLGYRSRQRYWYILGCTMQIQSWWRGRAVVLRISKEANALLTLQCFARRTLGRQKYLERKFIFMLIQTAEQERAKKAAAIRIQEKMHSYLEEKQRDEAARIIQRFFLRVKSEVDQLVRAAKRRKKWRKKMMKSKNRNDNVEDALLEDAWMNAVVSTGGVGDEEPFTRHYTHLGIRESATTLKHSGSDTGSRTHKTQASSMQSTARHNSDERRNRIPPAINASRTEKPSTIVRLHHDDDEASVFSQLTGSTMTYVHPSRVPRIRKVGASDMDDDFQLEEAFIDAEIHHAKERRQMAGTDRSKDSVRHNPSTNGGYNSQKSTRKSTGGMSSKRAQQQQQKSSRSQGQHQPERRNSHGVISTTYSRGGDSTGGMGIERTWSRGSSTRQSKDPDGTRHIPSSSSNSRSKNNAIVKVLSASNNY